ncbi:SOS response-associated peptidase [Salmonirosea aquatica]|uniref:Abasic site processing protein n=1 Tax=Salmonirosea aquatica TaxID=2654236 RepID=A0A7C9F7Y8_9BACT|nr:SOS response-associated peptidase [Cytophagaceae bacterium SJW1-29]
MCYHTSLDVKKAALEARYKAELAKGKTWKSVIHANAYAVPFWPLVTVQQPEILSLFTWGMIPGWTKSEQDAKKLRTMTINCRYETMYEKPSFRGAASAGRRCLIPVTGFFEWHTEGKKKYPFYIHPQKEEIVSIAGLWDEWADPATGEVHYSYTMLTQPANTLMAKIHNSKKRMPCLLTRESEREYLNRTLESKEILELLSEPYAAEALRAYPISKQITSRTEPTDVPAVLEPHNYPELSDLLS